MSYPPPSTDPASDRPHRAYLDDLEASDPDVRHAALEHLAQEAPPSVIIPAAAEALADPNAGVREQAAHLLTSLGTEAAAEQVAPHIASPDITVRNLAGEVLVQMEATAVPTLIPYLDDPDHDVRKFAIDVLAQLPEAAQPAVDPIAACLDDDDANVRLAAIAALGTLKATEYVEALRDLYYREPLSRPDVVHAMGTFGDKADLALLEDALGDENPVVQLAAVEALSTQDAPEIVDLLLRQVEAVDPMARPIVLNSIIERCEAYPNHLEALPPSLLSYMLDMLSDPSTEYRCAAARGLRHFADEHVFEEMLAYAGHDDDLDMELFKTLTTHPTPFFPLVRAAETDTMDKGAAAAFTIALLAQEAISTETFPRVGAFLQRHFDKLSADDKMAAIGLCQRLGHPALQGVIHAAQADPDPTISAFATDTAGALS